MFGRKKKRTVAERLEVENKTSAVMEVMVEIYPDRYLLNPGDRMVIEADLRGAPFSVIAYDGGMTIYPGNDVGPPVKINGDAVEPDWQTRLD